MDQPETPPIQFRQISAANVIAVCNLSRTLPPEQKAMVADNALSIAQAHCSEQAYMSAIYAGGEPVGFLMYHLGLNAEDDIDCPGYFLWRLMIAHPHQGKGYGRKAMEKLFAHIRTLGGKEMWTSCGQGEGSPEGFYRSLGFLPTGVVYGEGEDTEIELHIDLM